MLSIKNLIQTGTFSVLIQILTLGQSILIARELGAVGRGELVAVIALPQLIAIIVNLGTKSYFALSESIKSKDELLSQSPIYPVSFFTGSFGVGIFYLYHIINGSLDVTTLIAGIYIIVNNLSVNLIAQTQGRGELLMFNYCRSIINVLYFLSIVGLTLFEIMDIQTIVFAWVGTELITLITLLIIFQEPLSRSDWKIMDVIKHLSKSIKFTLIDLYSTGNGHLEKVIFLTFISNKSIIGFIAISQSISSVNSFMSSSLSHLVYMDTLKGNDSRSELNKMLAFVSVAIFISVLALIIFGDYLLNIIYTAEYSAALPMVVMMTAAGYFTVRWTVREQIFRAMIRPEATILPKIFGTFVLALGLYITRLLPFNELIMIGTVYIIYQATLSLTVKIKLNEIRK